VPLFLVILLQQTSKMASIWVFSVVPMVRCS
jgi:hypothetical protein